jgi:hypothetical protein
MHPKKCLKSRLNRSHAWVLALSDSYPIENSKQNPARTLPHAMHPASDKQSKPSKPKGKPKNDRQSFALALPLKRKQKSP